MSVLNMTSVVQNKYNYSEIKKCLFNGHTLSSELCYWKYFVLFNARDAQKFQIQRRKVRIFKRQFFQNFVSDVKNFFERLKMN